MSGLWDVQARETERNESEIAVLCVFIVDDLLNICAHGFYREEKNLLNLLHHSIWDVQVMQFVVWD